MKCMHKASAQRGSSKRMITIIGNREYIQKKGIGGACFKLCIQIHLLLPLSISQMTTKLEQCPLHHHLPSTLGYPLFFCPYVYIIFAMLLCLVCVYLLITFIVRNTFFYAHMTPTPCTHIELLGPIPGFM